MAGYNFEGDIDNVSERQQEFINNVIIKMGFENSKVSFKPVGKAGDNYAATVKRIIVEGEHGSLSMIAKIATTIEKMRVNMNTELIFRNEHVMYTKVLPKLALLQKEAAIPEQLRFAKCYGSNSEPPNEVILLEDLQTSDFVMLDRFATLPNECVKSVLKNFALLHSLSYVLKYKEPETYDNFKASLIDLWEIMADDPNLKMFFKGMEDDTIAIVEDPEHKQFVRDRIVNSIPMLTKLSKDKYDSKYTVIQQGDPWTNNIMFRFEGDKLRDSVMIDYQLSKNTSPVSDLLYMIFSCTDHKARSMYYYDWIDYYHSELDKSLANFNLTAKDVYPKDIFEAELIEFGRYQFGSAVFLASIMTKKSNDAERMMESIKTADEGNLIEVAQEMSILLSDEESKTLFKNKIVDLIQSFTEFGMV